MLFSGLFPWLENKQKSKYSKNQKNDELIFELKVEGITDEKILTANISPDILSVHLGKGSDFLHYPHNYLIKKLQKKYKHNFLLA